MCRYDDGTCVEEWRDVVGYEWYQVSNRGNVRSVDHTTTSISGARRFFPGTLISKEFHKDGSVLVTVNHHDRVRVDEAVANAFVSIGGEGQLVLHLDGNESNCDASNLSWVDESEYFEECYRTMFPEDSGGEWRSVVGYEGLYDVSDRGIVRCCGRMVKRASGGYLRKHSHPMKKIVTDSGYRVSLVKNVSGVLKHEVVRVDRVVASSFISAVGDGMCVDHKNGDMFDDRLCNLLVVREGDYLANRKSKAVAIIPSVLDDCAPEVWLPVVGYEGLYEVSSLGKVRSVDRYVNGSTDKKRLMHGHIMRLHKDASGYLKISLSKDGASNSFAVHRLVATAFIRNDDNLPVVDHINGIRDDNRVSNLRFTTYEDNSQYKIGGLWRREASTKQLVDIIDNRDDEPSDDEEWRDIEDYEGLYQVSNLGNVRSLPRSYVNRDGHKCKKPGRILRQKANSNGYSAVWMFKDGKRHYNLVHRMVANAFIPNPDNLPFVDHINSDRRDARATNLRWCTQKQNVEFAMANGRYPHDVIVSKLKRPEIETKRLRQISKPVIRDDGKVYQSQIEAARDLGYGYETPIRDVATGKRESCKGHTFRYIA